MHARRTKEGQKGVKAECLSAIAEERSDGHMPSFSSIPFRDTTSCKLTPIILHGVVSPPRLSYTGLYSQTLAPLHVASSDQLVDPPPPLTMVKRQGMQHGSVRRAVAACLPRRDLFRGTSPENANPLQGYLARKRQPPPP